MSVRVFAPAKINLTLKVGRPRADGLHPLESVVAFADVGDWIEAEAHPDSPFHIDGPFRHALLGAPSNLVLDAMRALAGTMPQDCSASVRLEKNLPVASGVGGGSSDAAAALKALNQLWGLNYDEAMLIEIARGLGADVPVCVPARSAFMTGAGERFAPIAVPPLHAVLLNPNKPLATAAVYRKFDDMGLGETFAQTAAPAWRDAGEAVAAIAGVGNDLEEPARAMLPEIAEVISELRFTAGVLHASLSGSGATVFALTENRAAAETLADLKRERHPDWWVAATTLGA